MLKQYSPSSNSGFTIIEFLVASTLGLMVVGLSLSAVLTNRGTYKHDIVSTRINQNLRSAVDIMGMNVRQAGEALDQYFPVVEIVDGASGAPDELVLRRNLYENEIFNVCQNITAGTTNATVVIAFSTASSACNYSSSLAPYITTWNTYRTQQGGTVRAYIYNRSTKQGEFFPVTNVVDNNAGLQMYVQRTPSPWTYSYNGNGTSASMYLLEEYRFRISNGVLQLIQNADNSNIMNVIDGVQDFQIVARMQDGTTKTSFVPTDSWVALQSLQVTLSGQDTYAGDMVKSSLTTRLFPRNILSH